MTIRTAGAHNDYLQFLADGGVPVAVPALAASLALARAIRRRFTERADHPLVYRLRVGAATVLAAGGLQEVVEFGHAASGRPPERQEQTHG